MLTLEGERGNTGLEGWGVQLPVAGAPPYSPYLSPHCIPPPTPLLCLRPAHLGTLDILHLLPSAPGQPRVSPGSALWTWWGIRKGPLPPCRQNR